MAKDELKKALELVKQQKQEGYDALYNHYFRFMFGVAYSVVNNESDCYDIIQNVMLRLCKTNADLFPTEHEAAWLHTVVKNEALMYIRREKHAIPLDEIPEIPVQSHDIEEFVDMEYFRSITSSLNEKQKKIVSMKILGGMTHKEIAKLLSLPIGTVQWIYNTSIKKLRHILTAVLSLTVFFGGGFIYNLWSNISAASNQGSFGTMEVVEKPAIFTPWLAAFAALFAVSVISLVFFMNFSDKLPTKNKHSRIL